MKRFKPSYLLFNLGIASLVIFAACKPSLEEESALRAAATPTHKLNISFEGTTGFITYELQTLDGINAEIKDVVATQVKSASSFSMTSIESDVVVASDLPGNPIYDLNIVLVDGTKCFSISSTYIGVQGVQVSCEGSKAASDTPATGGEPKTPTTVEKASSTVTDPFADAPECSATLSEDYLICRFFDGGKSGCYNKLNCIVRLTEAQCNAEIARLNTNEAINSHVTGWDCSKE